MSEPMIGAVGPDGVPPSRAVLWRQFLLWVLGTPALVAGGLGVVWLAYWAVGSDGMMLRAEMDAFYVILGLIAIGLIYPVALFFWVAELRDGLKARRDWEAMTPGERAERAANRAPTPRSGGKRRGRRDA